jgi:glyoxylase-like metal-dependent hydrolase (beta-lactamase superfamily II)
MHITNARILSRRSFMAATGISAAALVTSRGLLADENGIVPTMLKAAAGARIAIHPLRRNINVLEGSGGNIAVLTGQDGKLLIDAGFAVSRARILSALDSIDSNPIRTLINTHWHVDHTDGNAWLHAEEKRKTMFESEAARLPALRVGQPADIANAVLFLLTTPFATGSTVRVDGGGVVA